MHVYEEVAQHHGQLEVMRDALRAGPPAVRPADGVAAREAGVKWHRPGPDLIPAWVADMDFPVAPPIRAAITGMLDRGDLGYPDWSQNPLADAFADRMRGASAGPPDRDARAAGRRPDPGPAGRARPGHRAGRRRRSRTCPTTRRSRPTIATMDRRLVPVQLHPDGESWRWDQDDLERVAAPRRRCCCWSTRTTRPGGPSPAPSWSRSPRSPRRRPARRLRRDPRRAGARSARAHPVRVAQRRRRGPHGDHHVGHQGVQHRRRPDRRRPHRHRDCCASDGTRSRRTCTACRARSAWRRPSPPGATATSGSPAARRTCAASAITSRRASRPCRASRCGRPMPATSPGSTAATPNLPDDPAAFFREHAGLELASGPDYDPAADGLGAAELREPAAPCSTRSWIGCPPRCAKRPRCAGGRGSPVPCGRRGRGA